MNKLDRENMVRFIEQQILATKGIYNLYIYIINLNIFYNFIIPLIYLLKSN